MAPAAASTGRPERARHVRCRAGSLQGTAFAKRGFFCVWPDETLSCLTKSIPTLVYRERALPHSSVSCRRNDHDPLDCGFWMCAHRRPHRARRQSGRGCAQAVHRSREPWREDDVDLQGQREVLLRRPVPQGWLQGPLLLSQAWPRRLLRLGSDAEDGRRGRTSFHHAARWPAVSRSPRAA